MVSPVSLDARWDLLYAGLPGARSQFEIEVDEVTIMATHDRAVKTAALRVL